MYTIDTWGQSLVKMHAKLKKLYFVTKIVLTNCEKKLFYWSRKTFEIPRTIYSNSERSEQFFVTCSWKFPISNKLNWKKILGLVFQMIQVWTQVSCDLQEFGIRKNPGNTTQEMHICVYGLQITIWCQRD